MKAKYQRKKNVIKNLETGKEEQFLYNNEAKRASRKIQMQEQGALGRGILKVI